MTASAPAGPEFRRAYRSDTDRLLGGVCGGLGEHLGVSPLAVRVAMVLLTAAGISFFLYPALWILMPLDLSAPRNLAPGLESAERTGRRPRFAGRMVEAGTPVVLVCLTIGIFLSIQAVLDFNAFFWPFTFAVAGAALLWRQADDRHRLWLSDATGRGPWQVLIGARSWVTYLQLVVGLGLVITALVLFGVQLQSVSSTLDTLWVVLVGLLGLGVVIAPWAYRLAQDLAAERAHRVRTEERADLAAHLHDSVLQTLALIQKSAHDGPTVARLARAQERDLRSWLYTEYQTDPESLAGALREVAAIVEDNHGVVVDLVTVGDVKYGEWLRPLVAASREAVTNAAKHSGGARVDVYAEVRRESVEVFVRDRGSGFEVDQLPDQRMGIRDSILGRMQRHGGAATIRSEPGKGTEVALRIPIMEES